jgi:hypothetical protein
MAPSNRHEAPMRHARDTSNTAIAHSPLPEIADSIDGRAVDDVTGKRPRPLVFDVSAEDENGLVNNGQSPAKRPRRASSASHPLWRHGLDGFLCRTEMSTLSERVSNVQVRGPVYRGSR